MFTTICKFIFSPLSHSFLHTNFLSFFSSYKNFLIPLFLFFSDSSFISSSHSIPSPILSLNLRVFDPFLLNKLRAESKQEKENDDESKLHRVRFISLPLSTHFLYLHLSHRSTVELQHLSLTLSHCSYPSSESIVNHFPVLISPSFPVHTLHLMFSSSHFHKIYSLFLSICY